MSKYKTTGNQTLFDAENAAQKLSEIGNPLEKLDSVIDFEMFRSRLEESMVNHSTKSNAGAKQYDVVMMFKVMVLRQYYNLSYEQTEYQIIDRSSFKQFLGLASGDKVPDANTIRNFFEGLKEKGLGERLFQDFVDNLLEKGFIFNEGQIVDASFVLAPRQRKGGRQEQVCQEDCGDHRIAPRLEDVPRPDGRERQRSGHICRQRVCRTGKDTTEIRAERRDMRERLPRQSPNRRTEGREPQEIRDSLPSRTRVRVYGRCDARADSADHRHCESHRTHLPEMSNVQYVQVRAICKERNKITEYPT